MHGLVVWALGNISSDPDAKVKAKVNEKSQ